MKRMKRHGPVIALLCLVPSIAAGETPPDAPLAAFDEATLRRAGVRTDAASLLQLLRQHTRTDATPDHLDALVARLASPQFEQRERAAADLVAAGRPALAALRGARKSHADPEVRLRAGDCLAALESKLDPHVTLSAVRRLVHLRAAGAAGRLLDLLPHAGREVQDEIFHGLPRVARADGKLDPALRAALEDDSPPRRAAAALAVALAGDGADRARVRKLLTGEDAEVRLRAAQALLAAHDAAALPALIALLGEPRVEVSWSAEELLHWVAGDAAPAAKVGAASDAERKDVADAWTAWHGRHAAKLDWHRIEGAPRRPGLYLACQADAVWLGGCDGLRYKLAAGVTAHDAVLLPDNHLLVAEASRGGENRLAKRDLQGKPVWARPSPDGCPYVACQPLDGGHFYLFSTTEAVEVDGDGREVSAVVFAARRPLGDAWRTRPGRLLCRCDTKLAEVDAGSGEPAHETATEGEFPEWQKFAALPDGGCALAHPAEDCVVERDAAGRKLRALPVRDPWSVEALRDGRYLVSTKRDHRILELDADGRTLWEVYPGGMVIRVRSVLGRVRIGFDGPRPAVNLETAAHRLRCLRDPAVAARCLAAKFFRERPPTDAPTIDALAAALDDEDDVVSEVLRETLVKVGEPAVPALVRTLKTGTARGRTVALTVLAHVGPPAKRALPEVVGLVRDGRADVSLRNRAVQTLGVLGPGEKAAVAALLDVLKDDSDSLRATAALNLASVAPDDPAVVKGLTDALRDAGHVQARRSAAVALERLGPKAKDALPALLELLKSPDGDPELRCDVAAAVGALGREAEPAVPVLTELAKDAQQAPSLRTAAAEGLGRLAASGAPTLPVLRELLDDRDLPGPVAEAVINRLGSMGEEGVAELARRVTVGGRRTRVLAISRLHDLGTDGLAALPALKTASEDPDDDVRRIASVVRRELESRAESLRERGRRAAPLY
jgi:HEAT repeat protein